MNLYFKVNTFFLCLDLMFIILFHAYVIPSLSYTLIKK